MKDKIEIITTLYPQISPGGQDYLRNMAGTLNLIQKPALYPLVDDVGIKRAGERNKTGGEVPANQ